MFRCSILAAAVCGLSFATPASAQIVQGTATAIDGDTIDMTGMRIRLAHIDAPEAKQTCDKDGAVWVCGEEATDTLASIIAGQQVTCTVMDTDVYGRQVAQCQTRVFELGKEMARRGMAIVLDYAPYEYGQAEQIAQRLSYGLWAATFELPENWRAANPQVAQRAAQAAPEPQRTQPQAERVYRNQFGCAIKGNRSRRGEWIYHLPGRPYYDQTRAEELFCTESEAQAAGYRRSKA
ncbi:MAG: thermonuclease family protein [Parvularcula sp.]|jgi:endonuclease YncB( thermonuclease family)|nr:thermonuclease family protein [Parvularcula sp.]